MTKTFAVIDTETNWNNEIMSLGIVLADANTFSAVKRLYFVVVPQCFVGGMFQSALFLGDCNAIRCSRTEMIRQLLCFLQENDIGEIFAYNAGFDSRLLPELANYCWRDIMGLAAYRQYNDKIPQDAPCHSTGRLMRGYGVENMLRLLSGDPTYRETHNALWDAVDELRIMQLLRHDTETYPQIK